MAKLHDIKLILWYWGVDYGPLLPLSVKSSLNLQWGAGYRPSPWGTFLSLSFTYKIRTITTEIRTIT